MKILKTVFIGMVALALVTSAYGEPGKGQGKAKGHEKENQGQSNNGNQSSDAQATGQTSETRRHVTEKGRNDATVRATRPDAGQSVIRANQVSRIERGKSAERSAEKKGKELVDALVKAEKARWSYNPHDNRGQGNMGKPDMLDPYGFDKNSGREGSDRGRPIRMSEINWAEIMSIDFNVIDYYLALYLRYFEKYQFLAQRYTDPTYYWSVYYSQKATYYANLINNYTSIYTYDRLAVNTAGNTINYMLTFTPPEKLEGTTLLVTTTLTSATNYTSYDYVYNPVTRRYERITIYYDAGQAIMEQTQEVVLGTNDTFSFSYDPPTSLINSGLYTNLSVTVTEPVSGSTYTMTYDRQIYLYRCPYGKVYNAKTKQPVVGAKIAVHFEDGSIVPLDKASNPTAKNPQLTDATGRYGVKLQTDRKYYITAKADGYEDYKSEVFTEKWHVLREDISLTPLEQVAQK